MQFYDLIPVTIYCSGIPLLLTGPALTGRLENGKSNTHAIRHKPCWGLNFSTVDKCYRDQILETAKSQ